MASSNNSKSISNHSIPFSKPSSHVDAFEDMTAFSPPSESWLIPYSKKEIQKEPIKPVNDPEVKQLENKKYQLECGRYVATSEIPIKSNKSLGTDDHFKSAVCSKNLLTVCEKLLTNQPFKQSLTMGEEADDFEELSLMNEKSRMEFYRQKHGNRRSSQSLPTSPKLERKQFTESAAVANHNPYFTVTKSAEPRKEFSIAFITNLFGIGATNPAEAKANLTQKFEHEKSEVKSNPTELTSDSMAEKSRKINPKPHEYRDLNIFSPTSM